MTVSLIGILLRFAYMILGISDKSSYPPPLSQSEEDECLRLVRQGDYSAREKLILHNLRLAAHIVKKYSSSGKNTDDLMSISTIGLIKAIDSYKPENGTKFATYAGKCMQNEILMYFRSQKKLQSEISINETIDVDKEGNPLTYGDIISSDDNIADNLHIKLSGEKMRRIVEKALTQRERVIIIMRYGLDGSKPLCQREIAEKLGISRSYVSRIEKSALEKIRTLL